VLAAAAEMKRLAGQINVTIHALGILLCFLFASSPASSSSIRPACVSTASISSALGVFGVSRRELLLSIGEASL
jgi:hypothetical protein